MVKMVCWNVAKRHESWRALRAMEQIDVALLQETRWPPSESTAYVAAGREQERTHVSLARRVAGRGKRGLDYVFASQSMVGSVRVRALNEPDEWGPSDHCRLLIEVE